MMDGGGGVAVILCILQELVIESSCTWQRLNRSSINHLQDESRHYALCSGSSLRTRQCHHLSRRRQHHGQERRQRRCHRWYIFPKPHHLIPATTKLTTLPGWGGYLATYLTANTPVVNKAIGGRSARSYTNEGRFAEITPLLKANDIVVIEFGHNDGGSPNNANDNGRSDCPGTGNEVCTSGKTGEKVYTFNKYVSDAAKAYVAKGAKVIVASQTPNNQWEGGVYNDAAPRFVGYAKTVGEGSGSGVWYVDHFAAVSKAYKKLGNAATNKFFPKDHTHTSPDGAKFVANAFAQAVKEGNTPLKGFVKGDIKLVY
jgi:rhamnogalacturonan acetylesterase